MFPLTYALRSTSVGRAFILAAFIQGMVAAMAIEMRHSLDNKKSYEYTMLNKLLPGVNLSENQKIAIVFVTAFLAALMIYMIMWGFFCIWGRVVGR